MKHVTLVLATWLLASGCNRQPIDSGTTPYLHAATEAGRWLSLQAPDLLEIPDRIGDPGSSAGLGSGAAGRAVFFAELYAATSDTSFLEMARKEAWRALRSADASNYSLYRGLSGIGFAAAEVARLSSDSLLGRAAEQLFDLVAAAAPGAGGDGWGGVNDVLGGRAGIGLSLVYAHARYGSPHLLDAAAEVGDLLLDAAESMGPQSLRWQRGENTPFDLPNFSHGTAGVGYFLEVLGASTREPRFVEGASGAIRYIDSIADRRDGLFLVPYGVPNEGYATPYDIGWAHGPAGTGRFYYLSWFNTRNAHMKARLDASVRTLVASGIPEESADTTRWRGPFTLDRRFGMAGSAAFLIDAGTATNQPATVAAGLRIADEILRSAVDTPDGAYWSTPLYGFQGGDGEAVFTGYFYGAAGFGLTLLSAHYSVVGDLPSVRFPDDPFGNAH